MGRGAPPGMDGALPGMDGALPGMGGASPGMGGALPDMGCASPGMVGASPGMAGAPPGMGKALEFPYLDAPTAARGAARPRFQLLQPSFSGAMAFSMLAFDPRIMPVVAGAALSGPQVSPGVVGTEESHAETQSRREKVPVFPPLRLCGSA